MNNLSEAELYVKENEYWAKKWADLEWLREQPQFQNLILEGYFKDKAVNGVSLLANDSIIGEGKRSAIMEDLIAISSLQDFFLTVEMLGSVPPEDEEETEDEVL